MKKRIFALMLALALLVCSAASASTFDRSFSSLKLLVKANAGSHDCMDYTTSSGSDHMVVDMAEGDIEAYHVFCEIYMSGSDNSIVCFKLYTFDDMAFDTGERSQLLEFCNKWNYDYRYPRAFVDDDDLTISADGFLFTTSDCPESMVDEFLENMIYGAEQLLKELGSSGFSKFAAYQ